MTSAKKIGLWGMTRENTEAKAARKGDKLLFYLGQVGFISEAMIEEEQHELSGSDWKPYDPRDFKWGFKIKLVREFDKPRKYRFPNGINEILKIKSSDFQFKTFFEISRETYKKIISGEGAENFIKEKNEPSFLSKILIILKEKIRGI